MSAAVASTNKPTQDTKGGKARAISAAVSMSTDLGLGP